jgi:hypothetical protein
MFKKFLKLISVNDITFLHNINKDFFIDQSGKPNYIEIRNFEMEYFYNFITNLDSNSLYTVIPVLSPSNDHNKPYIVISRNILVSKYSSYKDLHHFILAKYHEALEDFDIDKSNSFHVILKYKRVKIDLYQVKIKLNS